MVTHGQVCISDAMSTCKLYMVYGMILVLYNGLAGFIRPLFLFYDSLVNTNFSWFCLFIKYYRLHLVNTTDLPTTAFYVRWWIFIDIIFSQIWSLCFTHRDSTWEFDHYKHCWTADILKKTEIKRGVVQNISIILNS